MMQPNGRPLGMRKTVQLMVIITILVWATQTLVSQWGYGAEAKQVGPQQQQQQQQLAQQPESFVPRRTLVAGTLEMRGEATVVGHEVKLKQVCRWSAEDNATFAPIADLVVLRLGDRTSFQAVSVAEVKRLLHDAGVSLAGINFRGATSCTIDRSDVQVDEQAALQQWIDANQAKTRPADMPNALPAVVEPAPVVPAPAPAIVDAMAPPAVRTGVPTYDPAAPMGEEGGPQATFRTLRDALVSDLATRLGLPAESLQVHFSAKDEKTLALSEPHFRFQVEPQRAKSLGNVHWDVTVLADAGNSQRVSVDATARAWQDQVLIARPLSMRQVIQETDVVEKRVLVDRLDGETLLSKGQVVGNQAARDLKPGMIMTAKLVEPVPLARPGQFVTVTVVSGGVKVKTVARAMDAGTFGQVIRVKNEATKDVYEVVLTGPQTAEMSTGGRSTTPPNVASIAD